MGKRSRRYRKSPTIGPGARSTPLFGPNIAPQGRGLSGVTDVNQDTQYHHTGRTQPPNTIADVGYNIYSPLQPIMPFGPPIIETPREWDYVPGFNIDILPARVGLMEMLRLMSQSCGILRLVIETRKDQLMRLPHRFQLRGNPKKKNARVTELENFFRKPDGKVGFDRWCRLILEDLLVIDAPTVYTGWKRANGKPFVAEVWDGATVKPLIDDAGRCPDYPSPAFQQLIKGLPLLDFTERELIYAPMRPRPQMPVYGYPPVEQILVEVTQSIHRALYQANFWKEGTLPELIMTTPANWTPLQVAQYQGMFDTLMAGNKQQKSRIRFVPDGMKPFDVKNANGEGLKADYDEWLAGIICYAYSVSKQPFTRMMNRSTSETAQEQAEEEGLYPLMRWMKDTIIDPIIQDKYLGFGYDDCEFVWQQEPEVDEFKQMQTLTGYVKEGGITRNELRDKLDLPAQEGGDILTVDTPSGPVPIAETVEANRQRALAVPTQIAQQGEAHARTTAGPAGPPSAPPGVGKVFSPFRQGEAAGAGSAPADHDPGCFCNDCLAHGRGAYATSLARHRGVAARPIEVREDVG